MVFTRSSPLCKNREDLNTKWITTLFTAMLLVSLSAKEAKAQTITIQVDSSVAKQLTVTATITGLPAGWSVAKVFVIAPPAGGKAGKGAQGTPDKQPDGTYKVTIYPDPGTYDVTAIMWLNDNSGNPQLPIFSAATKNVTVKAQ
jgi:hypothetical protein